MAKRGPYRLEEWLPSRRVHKHRSLTEAQFQEARQIAIRDMAGFLICGERAKFIEMQGKPERAEGSTANPLLVTKEEFKMKEARDLTFFVPLPKPTIVVYEEE